MNVQWYRTQHLDGRHVRRTNLPPALTSATYNANNQQTAFGTTTETYDLNGNLVTSTEAGVTTTYTWNARNQLTGISRTGLTASLTYDSFGRRTGKTVNGTTTNFLYDGLNPVQEKNGGTVTANLLTGLVIDEFFTRTDSVGVRALLPDALGSTVALADNTGALQTQYTYEPFGVTTQTGAASTNSYKFTGREDDGTGLSYYRARYYQPRLQRFISKDPIEMAGGLNVYSYVSNNPINFIDPLGLSAQTNWNFFWDWVFGRGQRNRRYGPNDTETQEMKCSLGANQLRQAFGSNNYQNTTFDYDSYQAYWDTLGNPFTANPFNTAAQVGGFGGASAVNNGNGTVTYTIPNTAGTHSFFYHIVPNRSDPTGPMSNINQTFQWTEPIGGRKDPCQ